MLTRHRQQSFSKPAYKKVEEDLRARIRNGHWVPGAMLPGRKALAVEYGVNLDTIQRGIKQLVAEGILIADSRRGTFVALDGVAGLTETVEMDNSSVDGASTDAIVMPAKQTIIGLAGYVLINDQDWICSPVNARCLDAMESAAVDAGLVCRTLNLVCDRPETPLTFCEAATQLAKSKVAGIVLMVGIRIEPVDLSELMQLDIPIVVVAAQEERWPLPTVYYDHRDAGQLAGRHLLDQGCRDLLYFSLSLDKWSLDRRTGAQEALMMVGRPVEQLRENFVDEAINLPSQEFHQCAKQAAADWLKRGIPFDGVIAANDSTAFAFMAAAEDRGLFAGKDYAILGFDDMQRSRFLGLTSLRPPIEEMGKEAVHLLASALQGKQISRRVTLHSKLIVRESSLLNR